MRLIFNWAILIVFSLSFSVAEAMPPLPRQSAATDGQHALLVSEQSQRSQLKSLCQRKFGERFMGLGKAHGRATCLLRDSTAKLEKRAAKNCNSKGTKFVKILRIRVKGHKYITTFMCKHFGDKSHLREA
ncbi:MAG TPA: hypothetical protein VIJ49_09895 [Aestuariivirga sp.]